MKLTITQTISIILAGILIINMVLMALGVYDAITFWIILLVFGVAGLWILTKIGPTGKKKE